MILYGQFFVISLQINFNLTLCKRNNAKIIRIIIIYYIIYYYYYY